jgi:hypothetical protein
MTQSICRFGTDVPLVDHSSFLLSVACGSSVTNTFGTRQIHQIERGNKDRAIVSVGGTSVVVHFIATFNGDTKYGVTAGGPFVHGCRRKSSRLFALKEDAQ